MDKVHAVIRESNGKLSIITSFSKENIKKMRKEIEKMKWMIYKL